MYRLPQSGPSEAAQAAGAAYLYQIFRRSDGTGWVQWFQGQTGLTTTWHFNSAQFDPMPVGGPFGGIVTVSQPASLPVPPPPTDPLSGVENPNPTDPVWPLLYCFLANAEANAVAPPATSPLPAADAVLRDLLVAHQNAIRTAIQTPPPPAEEEPIQLYDSLGQRKADFFRFKLATVPPDTDHDGMPNDLESQTSYGVVINEAVYANSSGFTDEQGFVVDWIELRNLTAAPVSLAGWGFTTSSSLPGMVIFDSTVVVPASGYLLVLASGRGTNPAKVTGSSVAEVHLPFTLPDSGGYLGLFKPASPGSAPSVLVHRWNSERSPSVPATGQNVSWGITYNDLGQITWAYFGEPTPGAENAPGGYNGISLPPSVLGGQVGQVLPDGGSVTVGFGPPSTGAAIYYTVNGSWPTTLSDRYTSPLTISRTTVVRAIAVEAGKLPSRSITRSFISRLDTLAQQRPEGIISSSTVLAAQNPRLYEFAPSHLSRIAFGNDPELGPAPGTTSPICANVHAALLSAPIVHITRRLGESYVNTRAPWTDASKGEVPASVEWIDPSNVANYRQENCGVEPAGDGSLMFRTNVKISATLHFRSEYSATGSGRSYGPTTANSLYHGIYDLSEEINHKWISDNDLAALPTGTPPAIKALYAPDRYRVYRPSGQNDSETRAIYDELESMLVSAAIETAPAIGSVAGFPAWEALEMHLDMANYVDSLIGMTCVGSEFDNQESIRQFIFRKVDYTPPVGSPVGTPSYFWHARVANWDHSAAFGREWIYEPTNSTGVSSWLEEITSYTGIVHHPRFKAYFNTRLHVALAAGGVLTPEGFVPLLDEHRQALYPIVSADVARWLAEPNASGNPTLADYGPKRWLSETNQLRQTGAGSWFLNNRTNYLQSLTSSGHFTP